MTNRIIERSTARNALACAAVAGVLFATPTIAADHREAPLLGKGALVEGADRAILLEPSGGPSGQGKNAEGAKQRGAISTKPPVSEGMPAHDALLEVEGKKAERTLVPLDKLHLPKDLRTTILGKPTFEEAAKNAPKSASEPGPTSASGGEGRGVQATKLAPEVKKALLARKALLPKEQGADVGHVRVLMRIHEDGTSEVIQAQKLAGKAHVVDAVRGRFVAEVRKGSSTLAVKTLEDPFELRGLADPKNPKVGHSFSRTEEAFVTVDVPAGDVQDVSLRLLRVKPDVQLPETLDLQKFKSLRGKFDTISRIPNDKLLPALQRSLEPQKSIAPGPDAKQPLIAPSDSKSLVFPRKNVEPK